MNFLETALLDLAYELRAHGPLTVAGGFGLFLKRKHLTATHAATLIPLEALPHERSTNDVDLFVRTEVLADHGRSDEVRAAIVRLGYQPVPTAKFMQWVKEIQVNGVPQPLKIDVLVGPLGSRAAEFDADDRRARPRKKIDFHARRTEEALAVEERPYEVRVQGLRSDGSRHETVVFVPQAFSYLMMKLHAFDDRKEDQNKNEGRHHALDLYAAVGLMTEGEFESAQELGRLHQDDPRVERARRIVTEHFSELNGLGMLRLREHSLYRGDFLLDRFMEALAEIFGGYRKDLGCGTVSRFSMRAFE